MKTKSGALALWVLHIYWKCQRKKICQSEKKSIIKNNPKSILDNYHSKKIPVW